MLDKKSNNKIKIKKAIIKKNIKLIKFVIHKERCINKKNK